MPFLYSPAKILFTKKQELLLQKIRLAQEIGPVYTDAGRYGIQGLNIGEKRRLK